MSREACRWPGCDRGGRRTRGLCDRDYARARIVGEFDTPWLIYTDRRTGPVHDGCRWPDCTDPNYGRGFCHKHYQRAVRLNDFDQPWQHWQPNPCQQCGKPCTGRNRIRVYCSDYCAIVAWKRANPDRAREIGRRHSSRRRALMAATTVEDFTDDDVRLAHGDTCYLCGEGINYRRRWPHPESPSLDHIVPISRGGTHTLDNVAFVHLACNHAKNNRPAPADPRPTLFANP